MSEYESIFAIAMGMGTLIWLVGAGAGDIVEFDEGEEVNFTESQLQVDISEFDESESYYVFYNSTAAGIQVNTTAYQNRGLTDPDVPQVHYPGQTDAEQIEVTVEYPENATSIAFCRTLTCSYIPTDTGEEQFTYSGEPFSVEWKTVGLNGGFRPYANEDIILKDVRLVENPAEIDRNFIQSLAKFASVSTGYSFVNEVVIVALLLVISALLITLGARGLPFF